MLAKVVDEARRECKCRGVGSVAQAFPLVVLLAALTFWAFALLDFASTPERQVRTFPRQVWLVILVLGSVAGGVAWWVAGRPAHGDGA